MFVTTKYWSVLQTAGASKPCHLQFFNMRSIWIWVFPSWEIQVHSWMFQQCAFGNRVFLSGKSSYSNDTITTTFIQTVTYNSPFQTVSSFQFCITFFKKNFGMALRKWPSTRSNCSYNFIISFYYQFYAQLTSAIWTISHQRTLTFHIASYQ